jgi:DNA-binding NarL/FixJ family response regulator
MRGGKRPALLIADDDPVTRLLLEQGLVESFEIVAVAADAAAAVDMASATLPDVALVDVEMPLGGGLRAVQGIVDGSPDTAIVVLSGDEAEASVRDLIMAGAVAYRRKGIEFDLLAKSLLAAIAVHRSAADAAL